MDSLFFLFFSFFLFFFFFNDGTTGIGEEKCASLHVSKNGDNFQVSWTCWTHSVKFPAIKKVISDCAISKKRKKAALVGFIHVSSLTTGSPLQKQQEKVKSQQLKQVCIQPDLQSSRTKCFSLRELKTGSSILDYFYAVAGRNLETCVAA